MVKKRGNIQEVANERGPVAIEEASTKCDLRSNLAEVKKWDGVVGYILRDESSALVDFNDPAKMTDYAILSSATHEAAEGVSTLFGLGKIQRTVVQGKMIKMVSLDIDDARVSVFTQATADTDKIMKKLQER